ncbi:hypothetical protein JF55_16805 [Pseudomonas sp. 1-7]|nr:hypothetical protein JF55_22025 [Pseudomonas sp. 1-7]KFJ90923.1 hypothetical protein JF55_16805 [Pseudomonas sp. 1-7]
MRAATGLHRHHTRLQLAEKIQHLMPFELLAAFDLLMAVDTMNLKNLLCQIHAYAFKFHAGSPSGIVCFVTFSLAQ